VSIGHLKAFKKLLKIRFLRQTNEMVSTITFKKDYRNISELYMIFYS